MCKCGRAYGSHAARRRRYGPSNRAGLHYTHVLPSDAPEPPPTIPHPALPQRTAGDSTWSSMEGPFVAMRWCHCCPEMARPTQEHHHVAGALCPWRKRKETLKPHACSHAKLGDVGMPPRSRSCSALSNCALAGPHATPPRRHERGDGGAFYQWQCSAWSATLHWGVRIRYLARPRTGCRPWTRSCSSRPRTAPAGCRCTDAKRPQNGATTAARGVVWRCVACLNWMEDRHAGVKIRGKKRPTLPRRIQYGIYLLLVSFSIFLSLTQRVHLHYHL